MYIYNTQIIVSFATVKLRMENLHFNLKIYEGVCSCFPNAFRYLVNRKFEDLFSMLSGSAGSARSNFHSNVSFLLWIGSLLVSEDFSDSDISSSMYLKILIDRYRISQVSPEKQSE